MNNLFFDEKTLYDGNIFKFEERLQTHVNKYIDGGALLCTYFSQDQVMSTVDRGIKNIDELFGNHSPLRFHQINDLPLYGLPQANPENSDELQIEDIDVEGSLQLLPSTVIPQPFDFFIIQHMKMNALFEVKNVSMDSMKVNGYYKIDYRLHSTSAETINQLKKQVIDVSITDLNMIGTKVNPIIQEDDFVLRSKIEKMINQMIDSYIGLFYNDRHNCFIYNNLETGERWFDMCGHQFMQQYALINHHNSPKCIILGKKIEDSNNLLFFNNSIFKWIEMHSPNRLLQKFNFILRSSTHYQLSSFFRWSDEIQIMIPLKLTNNSININYYSYFNDTQINSFLNTNLKPFNEYEKLIWKYINKENLTLKDISLYTGDSLFNNDKNLYIYLYTPIIIYILRHIMKLY